MQVYPSAQFSLYKQVDKSDTVTILLTHEMHTIKLWGVELPVCAKVLQVKPDDTLHTIPVVFGVTDLKVLFLPFSHRLEIWPLVCVPCALVSLLISKLVYIVVWVQIKICGD